MTKTIERNEWKRFFDDLSEQFVSWETTVEVISDNVGAQKMSEGLPFGGITLEENEGHTTIELLLGIGTENHQSHIITDPEAVAFETETIKTGGVLDIEDKAGTKTLVSFVNPIAVLVEHSESEFFAAGN